MSEVNFLQAFIEEQLKLAGYDDLSSTVRQELVPQFIVEAQRRLGSAIMPHLSEATAQQLVDFTAKPEVDPEAMWNFWQKNVPNFESIVKDTLNKYAAEMQEALKAVRS
ncbi:MAG: DUF5663 domain-containing protein [Candidatus Magasanikbacteria bacterium]